MARLGRLIRLEGQTGWTALKVLLGAVACLLVPLASTAESQLGFGGERASAHLLFKIVIPQTLSVAIAPTVAGAQTLEIGGNVHSVFQWGGAGDDERHQVFLSGSAHRSIVRFAACSRTGARSASLNCTVSMP